MKNYRHNVCCLSLLRLGESGGLRAKLEKRFGTKTSFLYCSDCRKIYMKNFHGKYIELLNILP